MYTLRTILKPVPIWTYAILKYVSDLIGNVCCSEKCAILEKKQNKQTKTKPTFRLAICKLSYIDNDRRQKTIRLHLFKSLHLKYPTFDNWKTNKCSILALLLVPLPCLQKFLCFRTLNLNIRNNDNKLSRHVEGTLTSQWAFQINSALPP